MVRTGNNLLRKCGRRGFDSPAAGLERLWFSSCWTSEFTTPQQANGSSVLVFWNKNRPNVPVLLAVTWYYVRPAVSSLDIGAGVKTFLLSILHIAALMKFSQQCCWRVRGLVQSPTFRRCMALCSRRRFEGSWPCTVADVSKDRGLVQSPTFRRIVDLYSRRRFEGSWPCAVADVSKDRDAWSKF